jgi:hypothetical protein
MHRISLPLTIALASFLAIGTRSLEAQATSVIAVFHQGQQQDGHLWESYFNGTIWEPDGQLQNVGMINSPSAVVYDGGLYVFHQGVDIQTSIKQLGDNIMWYSYFDGTSWYPDAPIDGAAISSSPSALWFTAGPSDSGLYVFHDGVTGNPVGAIPPLISDGGLWYSFFNGTSVNSTDWVPIGSGNFRSQNVGPIAPQFPNLGMSESPSAIAYPPGAGGGLYVFHQGSQEDGQLWYAYFDGTTWHPDQQVQNVGMSGSPSVVEFGSGFAIFHQGYGNDGQLWYTYFDGTSWYPDTQVQGVGMSESPSAVNVPGLGLCVFHQGYQKDGWLWQTCLNGTNLNGTTWTSDTQVQGTDVSSGFSTGPVGMSESPSAVVYPPQ